MLPSAPMCCLRDSSLKPLRRGGAVVGAVILSMLASGCREPQPTRGSAPADPATQGPRPVGPPPPGPGSGPAEGAEDLATSWRSDLAVAVPALPDSSDSSDSSDCADVDGDGFGSALACPALPAAQADCDDHDPAVTPATERWVRPGPFIMGSRSAHAGLDEGPVHVVELSGFCLDIDEVTVGEWAAWLRSAGRSPRGADVRSLDPALQPESGRAEHPAEGVTWAEARDHCAARGQALPTEAQWEKAARGGCELGSDPAACDPGDLRPYPWGATAPDCQRANHQDTSGGRPRLCVGDTQLADAAPAGAGPYGHQHLAGNVWEYVADPWHPSVYTQAARRDPGGPAAGEHHVLRGGSWNTFSTNMRVANRFNDLVMGSAAGFRCARPTVAATPDDVQPLVLVTLSGTLAHQDGPLEGRAIYVTAFPADGAHGPGRSPVAELRLQPSGQRQQPFSIQVPVGGPYELSAALDAGTGGQKGQYVAASGSGGFGSAEGGPVQATADVDGLRIVIRPSPAGGPPPGDAP